MLWRPGIALALTAVTLCSFATAQDGTRLEWRWSKNKASLVHSINTWLHDDVYKVQIVRDKALDPLLVRFSDDGRETFAFNAHWHTVFARWEHMLFIAEYHPNSSGCSVVAVELKTGKMRWHTECKGIGPTDHSKYLNLVNIDTDGKRVIINGNEAHGRYVEHLDMVTGKTIAHRKLESDPKSLLR